MLGKGDVPASKVLPKNPYECPQIAVETELGVMATIPGHFLGARNGANAPLICILLVRKLWCAERRGLMKDHAAGQRQAAI